MVKSSMSYLAIEIVRKQTLNEPANKVLFILGKINKILIFKRVSCRKSYKFKMYIPNNK